MSGIKNGGNNRHGKLVTESESDDMDDFIEGPKLKYGYQSSDEEDNHKNGDLPKIQQDKTTMAVTSQKLEEIFAEKMEIEEQDEEDLEMLLAKQNLKYGIIAQDKVPALTHTEVLESSKAFKNKNKQVQSRPNDVLKLQKPMVHLEAKAKFDTLGDTVRFYIAEIYENPTDRRKLLVFGVTENGQRLTLSISDMERCLYFILRTEQMEEDQVVREAKAEAEIKRRLNECEIVDFDGEFMKMNYVFELEDLPRGEIMTYRVRYPFSLDLKNAPRPDWKGNTFSYVIGTTYTALELFIVKNAIKGPQWVNIDKRHLQVSKKITDTVGLPLDFVAPQFLSIPTKGEELKTPKLSVVSVAVKYARASDIKRNQGPNSKDTNTQTIYCISLQLHEKYNIESKTKQLQLQSVVFCLSSLGDPSIDPKKSKMIMCQTEEQLLQRFLEAIEGFDPDIISCHDSTMVLDAIITRLEGLNIRERYKLSRMGPLRQNPGNGNIRTKLGAIFAGRLLVDTFIHAKDLLKSVDYSLSFVSSLVPITKVPEITADQASEMFSKGEHKKLILNCLEESEGVFNLMNHLEIVQLTRQLTNICGNIWRRSLDNARAERNEFLLMHQCEQESIIIPDKFYRDKDDDTKREKYEGGFVIEPEKDLYTEYILLLDFNSLYPSIIREYNICFSKVKRHLLPLSYYYKPKDKTVVKMEEEAKINFKVEVVSEPEREKQYWGFLPKLIHNIVNMRKVFKKKMIELPKESVDEYMAHDITQKAYKLVANSIYGCLGFENSRFYARDLAALITEKGREALKRARELVEKQGRAVVIYGDTDSLMIKIDMQEGWSEVMKVKHIFEVAQKLKKDINNEYRNKMLEIDIDGVFKPLNLIAKKKYMAKKLDNFDQVRLQGMAPVFTVEYKGIEVAKRDGCEKSRTVIKDIFSIILNNMLKIEDATTQIYDYFESLDKEMTSMVPQKNYKQYILSKQLNKHPNQYKHGAENLPHIRVAKRLIEKGEKAEKLVNHAIYYLIVKSDNEKASVADRAVDDATFIRSLRTTTPLVIDIDFYKVHEILPPVLRVLATIKNIEKSYIEEKFKIKMVHRRELQQITNDDEEVDNTQGTYQDTADSSAHLNSTFHQIKCPGKCNRKYPFCTKNTLTNRCEDPNCDYKTPGLLLPLLYNSVLNYIYMKTINFYNPVYKCRKCQKKWAVEVKECCPEARFQQNTHSAELHNVLYALLKVVEKMLVFNKDNKTMQVLGQLEKTIKESLKSSEFERIGRGFMSSLVFRSN